MAVIFDPNLALNALNASGIQKSNSSLYDAINRVILAVGALVGSKTLVSGMGYTKSTDANGTRINFPAPFTSGVVVAVSVMNTTGDGYCTVITQSNTYFQVAAYNNAGTRISVSINWVAVGVLQ